MVRPPPRMGMAAAVNLPRFVPVVAMVRQGVRPTVSLARRLSAVSARPGEQAYPMVVTTGLAVMGKQVCPTEVSTVGLGSWVCPTALMVVILCRWVCPTVESTVARPGQQAYSMVPVTRGTARPTVASTGVRAEPRAVGPGTLVGPAAVVAVWEADSTATLGRLVRLADHRRMVFRQCRNCLGS